MLDWVGCEEGNEHRTSNIKHRMVNGDTAEGVAGDGRSCGLEGGEGLTLNVQRQHPTFNGC